MSDTARVRKFVARYSHPSPEDSAQYQAPSNISPDVFPDCARFKSRRVLPFSFPMLIASHPNPSLVFRLFFAALLTPPCPCVLDVLHF